MADQNFRVKRGLEVGVGGTVLFAESSGNIGINSSSPTTALDVQGTVTATEFSGDLTGDVTGDVTGTATTATNLSDGANITTGTISDDRLPATITSDITGNAATATTATNLSDGANITTGTISSDRLTGTYNIDISGSVSGDTVAIGTATVDYKVNVGAGETGVFLTGTGNLNASGISTISGICFSSGIVTAVAGCAVTYYGDGSKLTGTGADSDADGNLFFGKKTGAQGNYDASTGSACHNIAFGDCAGYSIEDTAEYNIFLGLKAGCNVTTGTNNIFLGQNAGLSATNHTTNLFIGCDAGCDSTASDNTFLGTKAGARNTTGCKNIFVGANAGYGNTSGSCNIIISHNENNDNNTGNYNVLFHGRNDSGNCNIAILGGSNNNTGNGNIFLGKSAGTSLTSGNTNVYIGQSAGSSHAT